MNSESKLVWWVTGVVTVVLIVWLVQNLHAHVPRGWKSGLVGVGLLLLAAFVPTAVTWAYNRLFRRSR